MQACNSNLEKRIIFATLVSDLEAAVWKIAENVFPSIQNVWLSIPLEPSCIQENTGAGFAERLCGGTCFQVLSGTHGTAVPALRMDPTWFSTVSREAGG